MVSAHRKGSDFERLVAKALGGTRVPLSGAVAAFPGDVVAWINGVERRIECKKRATGFKQDYGWLRDNWLLVKAADRMPPLAVLKFEDLVAMVAEIDRLRAIVEREAA